MVFPTIETVAAWFGACAAIAATVLTVWRKQSGTSVDVSKDSTTKSGIEEIFRQLQAQNSELKTERDLYMKEAKLAWDQRTADASKIAGLAAENDGLKSQIREFTTRLLLMEARISNLNRVIRSDATLQTKLHAQEGEVGEEK